MGICTDNPNFCRKPVAELLKTKHHFVIPSYQRGYRWEEKQVVDLLEDINEFSKQSQEDSYYLQPLVVKPTKLPCKDGGIDAWEILDGQQRLTTLRLILMYLFENSLTGTEKKIFSADLLYDIMYTNRPQLDFTNPNPQENIDSYYLNVAKTVIEDWFIKHTMDGDEVETAFKHSLMYTNKPSKVKFIWYVVDEESLSVESIRVFNRLNKGKISLTSSELIKALFIMDRNITSNFDRTEADKLALDWNLLERQFQDDKFWYFISNSNDSHQTRVDILFDFVTEKDEENSDRDFSYRMFQNLYDYCRAQERGDETFKLNPLWERLKVRSMRAAWDYVVKTNDSLLAWYDNNIYYHYVGYLVSVGNQPLDIYRRLSQAKMNTADREWTNDDTRVEFHKQIMESFKEKDVYLTIEKIDDLEYKSKFVFRLLLLFNVESSLQRNQRFAFDAFKKKSWDVEHIDSQNNASLVEREDRLRWLKNVAFILNIESNLNERKLTAQPLYNECQRLIPRYEANERGIDKEYTTFCQKALAYFSADEGAITNKDSIGNLTLLDYKTNREYQDAPFPYKRYCIINEDRAGRRFIPIGTRNIFLKYYTNSDQESSFIDSMRWSKPDLDGYMAEIHRTVDNIFNVFNPKDETSHE